MKLLLASIGLSAGFITASALVALITTIGVISRLAQMTHTACFIHWYENCFMAGCMIGNGIYIFDISLHPISMIGIGVTGIFIGIFLGCFIGALAEVLQIFPILFKRLRLKTGTKCLLVGLAGGKIAGALLDLFYKN